MVTMVKYIEMVLLFNSVLGGYKMSKKQEEQICCGDTNHCKECEVFKNLQDFSDRSLLKFTTNDLGRCDFYTGVNAVKVNVTIPH